ncbi:MAG: helix-turn-helix transcriptional regulator [Nostoc sp. NMS7]|uniref:helix-turn-helix domain-containing protein n=1 Tax=Nostoc sp. NMS7 TaxID=2815391 RepID=UPI0025FC3D2E|nr:helix-turn-helix transcriptional regulator [Nostoc sp. NMS7]MBN3945124.1 helix-turn-helix transcriptional regulator [Nostoc sp. NMS7]
MNFKKPLAIKQPEVSKFIRELRLITGLTQEQFAAALGVTFPTVNRWENRRNQPSPIAMKQIEKLLFEMGDRGQELLAKHSTP